MESHGHHSLLPKWASPQEAADKLRAGPPPIDVEQLAQDLGIRVLSRSLGVALHGLTLDTSRVFLNSALSEVERRYALAHEIAHVLVRRGRLPAPGDLDEELIADRFARELLLGRADPELLAQDPDGIAITYGVPPATVAVQAATQGLAPQILRTSDGVICCRTCGSRLLRLSCRCARFRVSEVLARTLPTFAAAN